MSVVACAGHDFNLELQVCSIPTQLQRCGDRYCFTTGQSGIGAMHRGKLARQTTSCSADKNQNGSSSGGGFFTGFLVGGAVCGTLAFLFAPQ
ncbi:hypothetical protein CYMTET_11266, partial [Cymbomonas tetramitiformis]